MCHFGAKSRFVFCGFMLLVIDSLVMSLGLVIVSMWCCRCFVSKLLFVNCWYRVVAAPVGFMGVMF